LLRGLTVAQPDAGWDTLLPSNLRLLLESAPRGFAPDWALYDAASGRFLPDERSRALGSYDAIRVYLWIGSLHPDDPDRPALLRAYQAMAQHTATAGAPPEEVDIGTGVVRNNGPAGFSAALLPFLRSAGLAEAARTQRERLRDARPEDQAERYYDNVLSLFGRGWDEGRYRYGADGSLATRWSRPACKPLP
jgi:endoglucanase